LILNFEQLAADDRRRDVLEILEEGLAAALPQDALRRSIQNGAIMANGWLQCSAYDSVYVVAFGKAATAMADVVCGMIDVVGGLVVVPHGQNKSILDTMMSAHPIPDSSSVKAAKAVVKFLGQRSRTDFVLFLVSGGASSLLCMPQGITLEEKQKVSRLLLRSGAIIEEFNCVRKHLSGIKGGQLVANLRCDAAALVISDVSSDDMSSIASGITYCDDTTYGDALRILKRYGILDEIPCAARARLERGAAGLIPETPKKPVIPNHVISSNAQCRQAMQRKAQSLGYNTKEFCVSGDIKDASRDICDMILSVMRNGTAVPTCIIFGGEATVCVKGKGKGGRNQELVLMILQGMQGFGNRIIVSSVGTDGIDGNTEYAGAISKCFGLDKSEVASILHNNDSNAFFQKYGGLIKTGQTGTNLADIGLILIW